MEIHKLEIPRSCLENLDENERAFYFFIGHFGNEINALIKIFYWCNNYAGEHSLEKRTRNFQALLLARILTGKLLEGWNLLQASFFGTGLSKKYEASLSGEPAAALKRLKRYFSSTNLIDTVRKKHAFHYDFDAFKISVSKIPDDEELVFYLAENNANSFYAASDLIANLATLESVQTGDIKLALEKWIDETSKVTGWFISFISGCMIVITEKCYPGEVPFTTLTISGAPHMDEIVVPYFAENDAIKG